MRQEILGIIPARGGSKEIYRKNIRILAGKPLLEYTTDAALKSTWLDRVVLSTEDEQIKQIGLEAGVEVPFNRPPYLAQDDTPTLPVIQHAVKSLEQSEGYRPSIVVILQPTSPFRTSRHIDDALELFVKHRVDSLVSVVQVPHSFCPHSIMTFDGHYVRPYIQSSEEYNIRQNKPNFVARNGAALYICTYDCLINKNSLYGDNTLPFFMRPEESVDIDDSWDWRIAEMLMNPID